MEHAGPSASTGDQSGSSTSAQAEPWAVVDRPGGTAAGRALSESRMTPASGVRRLARRPVTPPFRLGPLTITGVLDAGFAVVKHRSGAVLGITAALLVPIQLLGFWAWGGPYRFDLPTAVVRNDSGEGGSPWVLLATFGEAFFTLASMVAVAIVVGGWFAGVHLRRREVLRRTGTHTIGIVVATLCLGLALALGAVLCGVGALLPAAFLIATPAAMAVERLGPFAAQRRSLVLTRSNFGHALGVVAGAVVIVELVRFALVVLAWDLLGGMPGGAETISRYLLVLAVNVLLVAYTASVAMAAYIGLRVRTEALDLELEATEVFPQDVR